jgi:carbohydrate-binding DOMON domain-containing protein
VRRFVTPVTGRLTLLLAGALVLAAGTTAGAEVLATWSDPAGDDTGNGNYTYPTNEAFGAGGEADLLAFSIERSNGDLVFVFKIRTLVDPWGVGNRLTMVAVAIDTQEGGDKELRRNANVMLSSPSEYQVFAGGETVEVMDASSERVDVGATVATDIKAGTIRISVPIESIDGAASDWHFTPAVGLQDDYGAGGLGDFRDVKAHAEEWHGGGGDDLSIDPNIYDIIVPVPKKMFGFIGGKARPQAEILGSYNLEQGTYATLDALEIE